MKKEEIASLSVKILSLYIVVNAVVSVSLETMPYLQQQFYAATQGVNPELGFGSIPNMFARQIFSILIPLLIALILWKSAGWLGRRMVSDEKEKEQKQKAPVTAFEVHTIIISVIGLFVTINSIPQFILFFTTLSLPSIPGANFSTVLLQLINPLLYVVMGWFLLFNAARIARSIYKEKN